MKGFPHSIGVFLLYLSVAIKNFCPPHHCFLFGTKSNGMSSIIRYLALVVKAERSAIPAQYICGPSDLAHTVLPIREGPIRTKDFGRSFKDVSFSAGKVK